MTSNDSATTKPTNNDRPPLSLLLTALEPVVRPAMLETYPPDCGIATCSILLRVFRSFGFDAIPLGVSVQIYNSDMVRLLEENLPIPENMTERLALFEKENAWGIGIGVGDPMIPIPAGGYDGHLVLHVEETLVDSSLQFADRSEHGIDLGSFIACEPGDDFFKREDRPEYAIQGCGCVVVYKRLLDETYKNAKDWTDWTSGKTEILEKILSQTTERMKFPQCGVWRRLDF